jgi:hypothetical protein
MLKRSVSLVLISLSLGSLASCGSKVADKPVAQNKLGTTGAITKTSAGAVATIRWDYHRHRFTTRTF